MKVLLTGCAGFIGFHTAERLLKEGYEVLGIDSINSYYDPALKFARLNTLGIDRNAQTWETPVKSTRYPNFTFIRIKLEDKTAMERLFNDNSFSIVIHLAAQAGVRYSLDHPHEYIDSNIVGFLNILEGCRHSGVEHLVYASSSSVYGLNNTRPFSTHDYTDHPVSLYAATKKANELMAHTYSHLYRLPTTGLRFFTVYGPWGRPDMAYFKFTKAIIDGQPIDVYNNGDMWRDFTYIYDIVEGILLVINDIPEPDKNWNAEKPDPASSTAPYRVYNLGNNKSEKLLDLIKLLEQAVGKKADIRYKPMQDGDVYATEAEVQDLYKVYRWIPNTPLALGIQQFINWYRSYYR